MRYAIKDGERVEAAPNIKAICECCGGLVKSYCGKINANHFRHLSKIDCDTWYEPMTQWHIDWQNKFDKKNREVVIRRGEKFHRADALNSKGVVIEFQNSNINVDEIMERETFYGNMIWVVNAKAFAGNIEFNTGVNEFIWRNVRKTWLAATMPIFFDFGDSLIDERCFFDGSWSYTQSDYKNIILWFKSYAGLDRIKWYNGKYGRYKKTIRVRENCIGAKVDRERFIRHYCI